MEYEVINGQWNSFENDKNEYDLIYLDPPFFTQRRHKMSENDKEIFFDDIWNNESEYNEWLKNVVETCWTKLSSVGTIYSHNNIQMNSILYANLESKVKDKFVTNISWQRSHPHNNIKNSWGNIVDSIMVFSKTNNPYFNVQYSPLDSTYKENSFNNKDDVGYYSLTPITGEKSRLGYMFEYKGISPKFGWRKKLEDVRELDERGLIHFGKNKPYKKMYLSESKGAPIQNIWTDIFPITRSELNKREYPTQKPIKLLERIITSSCPVGGKVLDPFGGSGTTLMASFSTGIPSFVKIVDKNPDAIDIIESNVESYLTIE